MNHCRSNIDKCQYVKMFGGSCFGNFGEWESKHNFVLIMEVFNL